MDTNDVEDTEDVRRALRDLLEAAEDAGVDSDALAGLLTVHLAGVRGDVRLPLSMAPEEALTFRQRVADHVGETVEVELLVSEDVLGDVDLQLSAFGLAPDEE